MRAMYPEYGKKNYDPRYDPDIMKNIEEGERERLVKVE